MYKVDLMEQAQQLKTGTTTCGLKTKDAVVLAADMRASMGHIAYEEESQKLYKITDSMALTNAGNVGDSLMLIRFLRSHAKLYELEREQRLTVKGAATLLSNVMGASRYYPYIAQFLLGGIDNNRPELWEATPFGAILERKNYAVSGSGTEEALTVLDLMYAENLGEDEAIELATKAIRAGMKRDVYSGGAGISVMVIDKNGIRELVKPKEEVVAARRSK